MPIAGFLITSRVRMRVVSPEHGAVAALAGLFAVLAPLEVIGWRVAGVYVQAGSVVAALLAAATLAAFVSGNWRIAWRDFPWLVPFSLFAGWALLALLESPYRYAAFAKGMIQIVGVAVMVLLALGIAKRCQGRLDILLGLVRASSVTLGVVGLVAVVEFLVNNLVRGDVIGFSFLESIFHGTTWNDPGMLGGLYRSGSFLSEPAHMATFLCVGAGPALVRLGFLGPARTARLIRYGVPRWAAFGIIGGFAVSLSVMGYLAISVAALATAAGGRKCRPAIRRRRRYVVPGAAALLAAILVVPFLTGGSLADKLGTIGLIYDSAQGTDAPGPQADTLNFSALSLASNIAVMVEDVAERPLLGVGPGAHPVAYDTFVPDYAFFDNDLYGMNREEAGALLVRLLSETGLVGTALFLAGVALMLRQGWTTVRDSRDLPPDAALDGLGPLAAALFGSAVAVSTAFLLRLGVYFASPLWLSLALTAALASATVHLRATAALPDTALVPAGA